jgi:hypothetical protein
MICKSRIRKPALCDKSVGVDHGGNESDRVTVVAPHELSEQVEFSSGNSTADSREEMLCHSAFTRLDLRS